MKVQLRMPQMKTEVVDLVQIPQRDDIVEVDGHPMKVALVIYMIGDENDDGPLVAVELIP